MIIKFTTQDIENCQKFANSIDTGFYATRNQFSSKNKKDQQLIGKLSEFATYKYFSNIDINISQPDLNIYKISKKSWDFDLKSTNLNLHVKGQSIESGEKYGISWVFQKNDKHIFTNVSDKDYVSFVTINLEKYLADIKYIISVNNLHSLKLFKPMKLSYLDSKVAVYYEDLVKITKDLNLMNKYE